MPRSRAALSLRAPSRPRAQADWLPRQLEPLVARLVGSNPAFAALTPAAAASLVQQLHQFQEAVLSPKARPAALPRLHAARRTVEE